MLQENDQNQEKIKRKKRKKKKKHIPTCMYKNLIPGKFKMGTKFKLRGHRVEYKSYHHIFFDSRQVYVEDNKTDDSFKIYRKRAKCPGSADALFERMWNAAKKDKDKIPLEESEEEFISKLVNKWKHINEKGWH